MKNIKKFYIGIFLCIFFIYFGTIFQDILSKKVNLLLKLDNTNKASIVVNNTNSMSYFNLSDINLLKKKLKNEKLFAMSEIQGKVNFARRDVDAKIIGVTSNLNEFYNVNINEGSFFNESIEKENKFCAVLEDKLAYKLFGNVNVRGLKIKLLDHDFTIIGIIKRDSSIVQKISDDGLEQIYIPLETLMNINKNSKISYLQFKDLYEGTSGKNKDKVINLLSEIGKNKDEYMIIDYNIEKKIMEQKPLILSFILGIFCIYVCFKYLIKNIKTIFHFLKNEAKKDYFLNIIKKNKILLLKHIITIVFMVFSMFIIWKWIKFSLYISPKYIPDELINWSYYEHIFNQFVKESINNRIYLNPFIDLKLIKTNRVINLLFILTFISILIFNNLIKRILKIKNITKIVSYCATCTVIALLIISFICIRAKMPLTTDMKILFILWIFIFTKIIVYDCESI